MDVLSHLLLEPLHIELEFFLVSGEESVVAERCLILVEKIVHLPEPPLGGGRLGGCCGPFRLWVGGRDGEVSEDEPQLRSKFLLDLLHDRVGRAAVGTLVVPVLDEHHSGIGRPFNVVPLSDGQGQSRRLVTRGRTDHSLQPGDLRCSNAERIPSAPGLTPSGEREPHRKIPFGSMTNSAPADSPLRSVKTPYIREIAPLGSKSERSGKFRLRSFENAR